MYNHNKAQQSKNRVHISWDILYLNHQVLKLAWKLLISMGQWVKEGVFVGLTIEIFSATLYLQLC